MLGCSDGHIHFRPPASRFCRHGHPALRHHRPLTRSSRRLPKPPTNEKLASSLPKTPLFYPTQQSKTSPNCSEPHPTVPLPPSPSRLPLHALPALHCQFAFPNLHFSTPANRVNHRQTVPKLTLPLNHHLASRLPSPCPVKPAFSFPPPPFHHVDPSP